MQLTALHLNTEHKHCETGELGPLLLDSYTLHQDKRVARSEVVCTEGRVDLCVALATRDDTSTTIATVKYHTDVKTELHMEVCVQVGNIVHAHTHTHTHTHTVLGDH